MSTFRFDKRNLPDDLKTADQQYAFEQYVLDLLKGTASGIDEEDPLFAAVVGMLVLDGFTDVTAAGFAGGFWQIRGEAAGSTYESEGTAKPNSEVYKKAAQAISKARGGDKIVFYQELAFVSRRLIANTPTIPFDSPAFLSQVNVFDDEYVTEGPQGDTIDLPDLSGASGSATPDDLRPDNIRAVGTIMAAYNLEQLRLFDAVDRIVETWWNGQLPVGSDRGSKALDDFFWSSELRLTPAARHMQYGRVLGAAGGEVSTEVQPNTQFDGLWMRLIASLAEYDRQQRIADIVGGQRTNALTLTAEQVRQAGRNSAANASLYGWGGTQFAARRLTKHIRSAFDILNTPEIQSAYGVDGPYKVIERVAPEIGGTPNIVKYRTLADAGKHVFDIVAKYVGVWSGGTGKPLFPDPDDGGVIYTIAQGFGALSHALASQHNGGGEPVIGAGAAVAPTPLPGSSDISLEDQNELMRQAGNVIAVMGIQDEQVDQYSQPAETQYAPSVPSLAPLSGAPSSNGNAGLDQLRQMVSQGQVPTADQLKALILPATS